MERAVQRKILPSKSMIFILFSHIDSNLVIHDTNFVANRRWFTFTGCGVSVDILFFFQSIREKKNCTPF